jgi:ferrous iron transport protein A
MRKMPSEENCADCAVFPEKECVDDNVIPLSSLNPGEKATVLQACGEPELRLRLMEMGFVRGTEVKMVKYTPLKDLLEFVIRGYHVTLRKKSRERSYGCNPKNGLMRLCDGREYKYRFIRKPQCGENDSV